MLKALTNLLFIDSLLIPITISVHKPLITSQLLHKLTRLCLSICVNIIYIFQPNSSTKVIWLGFNKRIRIIWQILANQISIRIICKRVKIFRTGWKFKDLVDPWFGCRSSSIEHWNISLRMSYNNKFKS